MPGFDLGSLQVDAWVIALLTLIFIALVAFVVHRAVRVHHHRIAAGREDLVGKTAEVRIALKPRGTVFVEGEHWTAVLEEGRAKPGEEVVITKVDNLVLSVVKKQSRR